MRSANEIKRDLLDGLATQVDPLLSMHGYKRNAKSYSYRRRLGCALHRIDFHHDLLRSGAKGDEIRIAPNMLLQLPELKETVSEMTSGNEALVGGSFDVVFNQPVKFCAPQNQQEGWYARGRDEMDENLSDIASFLERWVLEPFDLLTGSAGLLNVYYNKGEILLKQHSFYIKLAAALYLEQKPNEAIGILREHLGATFLRKKFAAAYDFLENSERLGEP